MVTTADKFPVTVGAVLKVTVSEVAVAAVTVPTALPPEIVNATVLFPGVASNPVPVMVRVVAFGVFKARFAMLWVTTGEFSTVNVTSLAPVPPT